MMHNLPPLLRKQQFFDRFYCISKGPISSGTVNKTDNGFAKIIAQCFNRKDAILALSSFFTSL